MLRQISAVFSNIQITWNIMANTRTVFMYQSQKKRVIIQKANGLSTSIPQGPGARVFMKTKEELACCQAALAPTLISYLLFIVFMHQLYFSVPGQDRMSGLSLIHI